MFGIYCADIFVSSEAKLPKRGSTGYLVFFAFFTFACMCDLWLGLEIDNIICFPFIWLTANLI